MHLSKRPVVMIEYRESWLKLASRLAWTISVKSATLLTSKASVFKCTRKKMMPYDRFEFGFKTVFCLMSPQSC